jgi:hypothetical protein
MRSFRVLAVAILALVLALSFPPSAFPAPVETTLSLSPGCGPPGTVISFLAVVFGNSEHDPSISSLPDGLLSAVTITITNRVSDSVVSGTFTVAAGAHGSYLVTVHTLGIGYSISVEFSTACPQLCLIQLGMQEQNGTITWLPGYVYPGTPVSECQDTTGVLGDDVLGGTIMFHQFILNITYTERMIVTIT